MTPAHLFKTLSNIILPFTSRYSKWSPSLRSLHQNNICNSPDSHTCHMSSPSHSSRYYNLNNILCEYLSISAARFFKIWEVAVAYFKSIRRYLYEQTETNKEDYQSRWWTKGSNANPVLQDANQ